MADNQVRVVQTGDPPDYCRLLSGTTAYDLTAVTQGTKTFYIAENEPGKFLDGSHFDISGSTGNDGTYTCDGDATWSGAATVIVVDEVIPDNTVDGNINNIKTKYDSSIFSHTNTTELQLWEDANDYLYVGKDSTDTFALLGFMVGTAGVDYGAFTFEYWNGAWVSLTALHNSTETFSKDGFLAWSIPGDWATTTVDTQLAYWIRASQSAVAPSTPATALNLLLSVTLNAPLVLDYLMPEAAMAFSRDTLGDVKKNDLVYSGPRRLPVDCTHLLTDGGGMFLLKYWQEYRRDLYIDDLARTVPISVSGDSYYQNFDGYISHLDGRATAFHKQDSQIFMLEFAVYSPATIPTILGMSAP